VIERGSEFFEQLDRDMDQGWQMSREWVDSPNRLQRCQIVADKLLTALEKENEKLGMLMAGYILSRLPNVETVELDIQGEVQNNEFHFRDAGATASATAAVGGPGEAESDRASGVAGGQPGMRAGLSKMQAMAQAGQDVTQVFKVGKAYRFSVYDHASGAWQDSPLIATEAEAERLRQQAFKERYEALQQG
jgi:hypothetical protein